MFKRGKLYYILKNDYLNFIIYILIYVLLKIINENSRLITNRKIYNIIMQQRGFFQDVSDLAAIIKPIKDSIVLLENQNANLADCFLSLA
jgi:hypothetical protein